MGIQSLLTGYRWPHRHGDGKRPAPCHISYVALTSEQMKTPGETVPSVVCLIARRTGANIGFNMSLDRIATSMYCAVPVAESWTTGMPPTLQPIGHHAALLSLPSRGMHLERT